MNMNLKKVIIITYKWDIQGPGSYFGQDVTHWMLIPDSPDVFN